MIGATGESEAVEPVAPIEEPKPKKTTKAEYTIKKLIPNPIRLSPGCVMDKETYTLTALNKKNKVFMTHLELLIKLNKVEKV